jgi:hypothetical protein
MALPRVLPPLLALVAAAFLLRPADSQGASRIACRFPTLYDKVGAQDITTADLDGDGDLDLVAPNNERSYFTVLENVDRGRFSAPIRFSSGGTNTRSLDVGDFNGDGRPDVAVANTTSGAVGICLNNAQ